MTRRRFLITETDAAETLFGRVFALDPGQASGVPLPAFRVVANMPAAGSMVGEAIVSTVSNTAAVWDGNRWVPVVPTAIASYRDDTELRAQVNEPAGSYGATRDTGNLYIKTNAGWKLVGIRSYQTAAQLLADAPVDDSLGYAIDENTLWVRQAPDWKCLGVRPMADTPAIMGWNAPEGSEAFALDAAVKYVRHNRQWQPMSVWTTLEGTLQAAAWPVVGQMAVAIDTGFSYVRTPSAQGGLVWTQIGGLTLPVGGSAGQILSKIDATNGNVHWISPPSTLPAFAGHQNQYLRVNGAANAAEWGPPILYGTSTPTMSAPDGTIYVRY
jgi:hypothetical protein